MFRVRTVDDVNDFVGAPGDPEDYSQTVTDLWASEESGPKWCFLLEDGPTPIGRVGLRVAPTVSDPAWLGSLPPREMFIYGLSLPWEEEYLEPGRFLFTEAIRSVAADTPEMLEARINSDFHSHPGARCRLLESLGMSLFHEKHGFFWVDTGQSARPGDRLEFRSVAETGIDHYRSVMAPCGEGTLDRNDRYYWEGCGPHNWAAQMTQYLEENDVSMWLIGYHQDEPVGYVAVVSDEEWGATIGHIGVVPEHRGNGYGHDLVAAGTAAAQRSGIGTMLSDVDVLNVPMRNALNDCGHVEEPERWHTWVYRADLETMS